MPAGYVFIFRNRFTIVLCCSWIPYPNPNPICDRNPPYPLSVHRGWYLVFLPGGWSIERPENLFIGMEMIGMLCRRNSCRSGGVRYCYFFGDRCGNLICSCTPSSLNAYTTVEICVRIQCKSCKSKPNVRTEVCLHARVCV